jgi:hypothetical protein
MNETATSPAAIFPLIDEYKELLDRKDELKAATTENNKEIEEVRDKLAKAMIDAEAPKVSRNGYLYSLQDKVKYSRKGGLDDEDFFSALEDCGLGDIIKRTVNAQTLNSSISAAVEENDDELPEELEDYINSYQFYDVAKRKETNRTAAKAKKGE